MWSVNYIYFTLFTRTNQIFATRLDAIQYLSSSTCNQSFIGTYMQYMHLSAIKCLSTCIQLFASSRCNQIFTLIHKKTNNLHANQYLYWFDCNLTITICQHVIKYLLFVGVYPNIYFWLKAIKYFLMQSTIYRSFSCIKYLLLSRCNQIFILSACNYM